VKICEVFLQLSHLGAPITAARLTGTKTWGSVRNVGALIKRNEAIAKKKGWFAAAATGGSVAMAFAVPVLGVLGLAGSAYLAYDWFSYRAKNGMRF